MDIFFKDRQPIERFGHDKPQDRKIPSSQQTYHAFHGIVCATLFFSHALHIPSYHIRREAITPVGHVILMRPAKAGGCHMLKPTSKSRDSSLEDNHRPQG